MIKFNFEPEEAEEQLFERAKRDRLLSTALDASRQSHWDERTTYAIAACYLSDALLNLTEQLEKALMNQMVSPIITPDGKTAVFLGNYSRPMYDALTELVDFFEKEYPDFVVVKNGRALLGKIDKP